MSRELRAKQFSPFDALKGLHDALKLKEYEHDKILKGDLSEERILEISKILSNLKKDDVIYLKYYYDNHEWEIYGHCKLNFDLKQLEIDNKIISFDDILAIKKF